MSKPREIDISFVNGVICTMREEKLGIEPAIESFSQLVKSGPEYPLARLFGKEDEFLSDVERGAQLAREAVAKSREIVALADQAEPENGSEDFGEDVRHDVTEPKVDHTINRADFPCVICGVGPGEKHEFADR